MRKLIMGTAVLGVTLCFSFSSVFAADWPEVLGKIKAQYGQFNSEIKDISVKQKMLTKTAEGDMESVIIMRRKGDKFRTDNSVSISGMPAGMGPMTSTIICDGKDTWMLSSLVGKKKLPAKESKEQMKNEFWWEMVSPEAKITGQEKINGRDCYLVELTKSSQMPFAKIWVDTAKLTLQRSESKQNGKTMRSEFSDWRPVLKKWDMPYRMEMYIDGKLSGSMTVEDLQVNKGISDSVFDVEAADAGGKGSKSPGLGDMMRGMMKTE